MPVTDLATDATLDRDTGDLRSRILTIAERLFREMGYRKTTVADIAACLRMSPGNVYRFFPSKKALNEAVAERLLRQIEAELGCIVADTGMSARERLRRFVLTMHAMSAGQFTANRRMHDMVEVAMAESWEVIHAHIGRVEELLVTLVAEGARNGEFRVSDPRAAARCVQTAVVRFCHPALIAQCADREQPTIEEMTDFLMTGLRAE
ncbi:TetR family transcriptional regulator [Methylobacterium oxalidis]|uniref:TetR family transcriptional regulator n=1 Tax=Methylobacterium oxalidis TaxID=944322 RepID=A0A512J5Y1_9HYPH|nr:TetR family transcriptional regulator [Methylobacterium oxalidis]GEP05384.1 TetR family transcriptional regulator [Methylobacterium oxalidis]GJE30360.1 Nucleoid occlusion factor SlmA [Methylobacterium oxalidis]GLS66274.1 TetR family transcriptional regulator [Methylobacterium oxalidis]